MNAPFRYLVSVAVLFTAVTLSGCGRGPSLVEVTGTVSYRGQAVPKANVIFQPEEGPPAMGLSDEQGSFSLVTGGRPGTAAGPATVAVSAVEEVKSIPPSDEYPEGFSLTRSRIPEQYALVATSPLEVEVSASGNNHFDLELTD